MSQSEIQNGSVKELWRVSLSLMISYFSMMAMLFIDRLYVANYSPAALTAVASAGTFSWAIILGCSSLTAMSEIFVAQFNGAKRFLRLGEPVWQTIWISIISIAIFIPMAKYGSQFFYDRALFNELEFSYCKWSLMFTPAYALLSGLTGFFIGRGKTAVVQWLAIAGNTVNVILDPLLIFGYKDIVPSYGVGGAAVATGIGILFQVVILLGLFLSRKNAIAFGTRSPSINKALFQKILKIGAPPALVVLFEMLGWAAFYWMMKQIGSTHIVVASICQSVLMLFLFFGLGLEKGVAAIAGNLIGAGHYEKVRKVVRSGLILNIGFAVFVGILFTAFPDAIMTWFFNNPAALEEPGGLSSVVPGELENTKILIRSGLIMIGVYLTIENIRWIFCGILNAAGDTLFLMIAGAVSIWGLMVIPTYFLIYLPGTSIKYAFYIWLLYASVATLFPMGRFLSGAWKKQRILEEKLPEIASEEASL